MPAAEKLRIKILSSEPSLIVEFLGLLLHIEPFQISAAKVKVQKSKKAQLASTDGLVVIVGIPGFPSPRRRYSCSPVHQMSISLVFARCRASSLVKEQMNLRCCYWRPRFDEGCAIRTCLPGSRASPPPTRDGEGPPSKPRLL